MRRTDGRADGKQTNLEDGVIRESQQCIGIIYLCSCRTLKTGSTGCKGCGDKAKLIEECLAKRELMLGDSFFKCVLQGPQRSAR